MKLNPEVSIIIPCLNEEKAIGLCLSDVVKIVFDNSINAEIIVVDNESEDKSVDVILEYQKKYNNIILIKEKSRGYGSAYLRGLSIAKGDYIFIADGDNTYDFCEIPIFVNKLKNEKFDLVIGNRFSGRMEQKSMPWHHRYIGNPFFSFIARRFFKIKIKDVLCGSRAITRKALDKIILNSTGMEFAPEMIVKLNTAKLKITEVPIAYKKRIGKSKLRSFRDGWRLLKFLFLYLFNEEKIYDKG